MPRSFALILVTLITVISTSPVLAEEHDPLGRGIEHVRAFEYDEAIAFFQGVADDSATTPTTRLDALERIGAVQFNTERLDDARATIRRILDLDPGHSMTERNHPPPVLAFFQDVREDYEPTPTVSLTVEAIPLADDADLTLRAVVAGGRTNVTTVIAFTRDAGNGAMSYRRIEMTSDDPEPTEYTAAVPAPAPGDSLEYYVTAEAPSGHVLASEGTIDDPLRFETPLPTTIVEPQQQRRRWYRSWWFWTIVGVAVVGGTTTAVVLTLPEDDLPAGSLGTGRLE